MAEQNNCPSVVPPIYPYPPTCNCGNTGDYVTKYFGLPLWRANDVTSWLVGINKAMEKIDLLFHNFALRTGIDGQPNDLTLSVTQLENSVSELKAWQKQAMTDMANLTQVVSNIMSQSNVMGKKIELINVNMSNLDVRMKSVEIGNGNNESQVNKILETVTSMSTQIEELQKQVEELTKGSTDEPTGGEENGESGNSSNDTDNTGDTK